MDEIALHVGDVGSLTRPLHDSRLLKAATVEVRLLRSRRASARELIRGPGDVWRLIGPAARTWDREHFLTVILDGKSRVLGVDEVSVGTLTATLVHPREVLKAIILANGASFISVHNHPSGDPTPSPEDLAITRRIKSAAELIGIPLVDHVILGSHRFHSMASAGEL
ncbi:hypothetical protein K2Z84_11185 [Candidatus Binatia bacterium]|nr:hypothetical protein [Candidatus Binatia bacterium]